MQQVNDDMDELFRRAAEGYPLNTNSSDWDAVAKKLSDNSVIADNASKKKDSKRRALWLLLLLPLSFVYYTYKFNGKEKVSAAATLSSEKISATSGDNAEETSASPSTIPQQHPSKTAAGNFTQDAKTNGTKQVPVSANIPIGTNYSDNGGRENSSLGVSFSKTPNTELTSENKSASPINEALATQSTYNVDKTGSEVQFKANTKSSNEENIKEPLIKPLADNKKQEVKALPIASVDIPAVKKSKTTDRKQSESGLYAGLMLSPDLSMVKLQSVKKIGVNMGVILGYSFNKISIESGVLWDQKQYYSEGKYFNTKNIYLRPNTSIHDVAGVCYMIEVPLNIKYNLSTGKNYLSTSAGVSSYFMKKEKYDYSIDNSGQQYPYSASYNKPTTNIAAVANFSLGYNHKFNNNMRLLLEPYLRIPLKGIGTGSLPIMSTGVNIGITKKLSRK